MAGWHHQLDGHEFEWTPGVVDGQGGLACCNSCGHKESDMTEQLNWTELSRMNSDYRISLLWYLTKGMKSSEKSVRCSPATDKENGITSSHKLQKISGRKEEENYFDVSQSCFQLYWEPQNGLKEAEKIFRIFPEHLIVWRETEGVQRHLELSQESNFFF